MFGTKYKCCPLMFLTIKSIQILIWNYFLNERLFWQPCSTFFQQISQINRNFLFYPYKNLGRPIFHNLIKDTSKTFFMFDNDAAWTFIFKHFNIVLRPLSLLEKMCIKGFGIVLIKDMLDVLKTVKNKSPSA